MDKKEFRSLITPLSEKELYYQNHPELSSSFFKTIYPPPEETSILTLDNSILGDLLLSSHG